MKRALLIIIPILLVTYIIYNTVNSHLAYKSKMEAKKAEKERIEKNVKGAVGGRR